MLQQEANFTRRFFCKELLFQIDDLLGQAILVFACLTVIQNAVLHTGITATKNFEELDTVLKPLDVNLFEKLFVDDLQDQRFVSLDQGADEILLLDLMNLDRNIGNLVHLKVLETQIIPLA